MVLTRIDLEKHIADERALYLSTHFYANPKFKQQSVDVIIAN